DVVHVATIGTGLRVGIAHRAHEPENAFLGPLRRPPVELQVLEPALVGPHAHGARKRASRYSSQSHAGSRTCPSASIVPSRGSGAPRSPCDLLGPLMGGTGARVKPGAAQCAGDARVRRVGHLVPAWELGI